MMKILATSDTHGYLPIVTEPFDLFLLPGDICPVENHNVGYQRNWLMDSFVRWVKSLPYKNPWSVVVLVPGNHDFIGERMTHDDIAELEAKCEGRLVFLRHKLYEFEFPVSDGLDSLKIFGTPYCSLFGHWAFMVNDDTLEKKFSQIPEGVDILMSHDSPNINKLGAILEGPWKNDDTGNKVLAKHIERIKPKLFVSGHFHSGNHEFENINGTWMGNVSYVNEQYQPAYGIKSIDYDEETRTFNFENKN